MTTEDVLKAISESHKTRYIDDMISLLRLLDNFCNEFFENMNGDVVEKAIELGVVLDAVNRFGHCIMDEILEDGF